VATAPSTTMNNDVSAAFSSASTSDVVTPSTIARVVLEGGGQVTGSSSSLLGECIVNELLSYVRFYRGKSNAGALRHTVLAFYMLTDISIAKKLLVLRFQPLLNGCTMTAERRNSTMHAEHEAELDDILGIFQVHDLQRALQGCLFVVSNLDKMLKFGPEELNLAAVDERQTRFEATVSGLSAEVAQISSACSGKDQPSNPLQTEMRELLTDMQHSTESINSTPCARLDHLQQVCAKSSAPPNIQSDDPIVSRRIEDRKLNIVIFGMRENRDVRIWRSEVDDALKYVTGHSVDVVDTFRIGWYREDAFKVRPVLVKLRTVWDKRIILSSSQKLKRYSQRVFIVSDEPIEERRKTSLERMQYRAQRDGRVVDVSNGVLSVDDVPVYSLLTGYIKQDNGTSG
jgi:hypothetical protein